MSRMKQQDFLEFLTAASNGCYIPGECCSLYLEQFRTVVIEHDGLGISNEGDNRYFVDKKQDIRPRWPSLWGLVRR